MPRRRITVKSNYMPISNPNADSSQARRTIFLFYDYGDHSVSSRGNRKIYLFILGRC